jgi:hypothetical protein
VAAVIEVTLPSGFWLGREHRRTVSLQGTDERDPTFLDEVIGETSLVRRATALLARSLAPDRTLPEPHELARRLTAGDRDALLLHLRRLLFGDTMAAELRCPALACGEVLELSLRVSDLLVAPYPSPRPTYALNARGERPRIRFRLPDGADLEAGAAAESTSPGSGAQLILERCLVETPDGPVVDTAAVTASLSAAASRAVADAMARRDPQAEIEIEFRCPACGQAGALVLDPALFLLREIDNRADGVFREVDALARAYGWSEQTVLSMPSWRRRRYLTLLGLARPAVPA